MVIGAGSKERRRCMDLEGAWRIWQTNGTGKQGEGQSGTGYINGGGFYSTNRYFCCDTVLRRTKRLSPEGV